MTTQDTPEATVDAPVTLPSDTPSVETPVDPKPAEAAPEDASTEDPSELPSDAPSDEPKDAEATEDDAPEETEDTSTETTLTNEQQEATLDLYGDSIGGILVKANLVGEDVAKSYAETGTLTEDQFKAFEETGFSKDDVETYMAGRKSQVEAATADAVAFEKTIQDSVGGANEYTKMSTWFAKNGTEEQVSDFNTVVSNGDKEATRMAVANMQMMYEKTNGSAPKLISGKTESASETGTYYQNDGALQQDMADPKYKTNANYQNAVKAKIGRSRKLGYLK